MENFIVLIIVFFVALPFFSRWLTVNKKAASNEKLLYVYVPLANSIVSIAMTFIGYGFACLLIQFFHAFIIHISFFVLAFAGLRLIWQYALFNRKIEYYILDSRKVMMLLAFIDSFSFFLIGISLIYFYPISWLNLIIYVFIAVSMFSLLGLVLSGNIKPLIPRIVFTLSGVALILLAFLLLIKFD